MGLTQEQRAVLATIPEGHRKAITARQLSTKLGMSDRVVRSIIQELILDGHPIGSSVSGRMGYFKINNQEDFNVAVKHLKPRAINIFRRIRALEKIAARRYDMQLSLEDLLA